MKAQYSGPLFFKAFLAAVVLLFSALPGFADSIGGVDFGTAGMSHWSVLGIGGTTGIANWQFGTTATPIAFAGGCGPNLGNGCGGPTSNIGISGPLSGTGSSFSTDAQSLGVCGGCTPYTGSIFLTSNSTASGVPASVPVVHNSNLPFQAAQDANAGVITAFSLTANVTAASGGGCNSGNVTGNCTINPTINGGQNVIHLSSVSLGNNENLTFGGSASTTWVVIVSGDVKLNGPSVISGPGGTSSPQNILFIVSGNTSDLSTSGGSNNLSVLNVGFVELNGKIDLSPGEINGEVITGGYHAQFVSGTGVNTPPAVPEPGSMMLLGTGLSGLGFFLRRRTK